MNPARLVLADLENLTGKNPRDCQPGDYHAATHQLSAAIDLDPIRDRLVIAVNPALAFVAHQAAPHARILTRTGENGADERLCEELADLCLITRRYPHVILASGDHAYADPIANLSRHGVTTTVAALPGQLAARLRLAAHHTLWLTPPATPNTATPDEAA